MFAAGTHAPPLSSGVTNSDGRCDAPLLEGDAFRPGEYLLVFHAGDYFRRQPGPYEGFLDQVVVRFGVTASEEHYHIPLLLTPFGYTTYRGS